LQRWIGIVAVLNLAMIALLVGRPTFSNASRPVRGISGPMLAMEMVRSVSEVDAVLGPSPGADREAMRIKQYVDFGFIAAYAALYILMAMLLAGEGRFAAIAAGALGVIAAVFDVVENIGILRVIDTDLGAITQGMIDGVRYPSLIKWGLASLALGILGVLALRMKRTGLRIAGALDVLAALLGEWGLYNNVALQWLGLPMFGGLICLAILYFRPYRWNAGRRA
jgi:hypothetical protein